MLNSTPAAYEFQNAPKINTGYLSRYRPLPYTSILTIGDLYFNT